MLPRLVSSQSLSIKYEKQILDFRKTKTRMKDNLLYILKRLLYLIPVILGVCLIVFILFNLVSGDPAANYLGPHATAEQINDI